MKPGAQLEPTEDQVMLYLSYNSARTVWEIAKALKTHPPANLKKRKARIRNRLEHLLEKEMVSCHKQERRTKGGNYYVMNTYTAVEDPPVYMTLTCGSFVVEGEATLHWDKVLETYREMFDKLHDDIGARLTGGASV